MARRAEATLWMQIKQGDKNRYVSIRKVGNGRFVPNTDVPFEPGPYYLRYTQDGRRKWECVGPELALALNEQRNRQTALDRGKPPEEPQARKSLSGAVESYSAEVRTRRGDKSAKRAKWLLELFASVTKKHFIDEVTRDTLFLFMAYLKDQGRSPKTLRDRLQSIETFRKSFDLPPLLKKGDLPKVVKKIVDCYTEEEVEKMLAVANEDERFLILFLLATGVREQEAAHTVWTDIKWAGKVLRVSAKPTCRCPYCGADGFRIKDYEEREIPLPRAAVVDVKKAAANDKETRVETKSVSAAALSVRSSAAKRTAEGEFTKQVFAKIGGKECPRSGPMTWAERDKFMKKPEGAAVKARYDDHLASVR
jgi:integrase